MATLAKHESFGGKIMTSLGVMCVTLIRLPFKMVMVTNIIILLQLICAFFKMFWLCCTNTTI